MNVRLIERKVPCPRSEERTDEEEENKREGKMGELH